jgi:hypothetical protein
MKAIEKQPIPNLEIHTKHLCKFYHDIYKRMKIHFGYTYNYWLSDMSESDILRNVSNMVITPSMYTIFINVAIRIRKNNKRPIMLLHQWKLQHPDILRNEQRKIYYTENIERISAYNKLYNLIRQASRINIFKKTATNNI